MENRNPMLTLWGAKHRFCDGLTRRNFLKIGAFGAGLTLTKMLQARAAGLSTANKSAIMIFLIGGPSHLDMYDLKPAAPVEYRGEFKPIATNVPGVQICEHLPRQARMWDKLATVRSLFSSDAMHSDSLIMSGYSEVSRRTTHHPSFGAVVSKLRAGASDIPPFVSLYRLSTDSYFPGQEPGFLGSAHRAFAPQGASMPEDQGMANLRLAGGVDRARLHERRSLLAQFDQVRRDIDASGTMRGLDAFAGRAFDMIASGTVRQALDLTREEPRSHDRYRGCEQFLLARRLIEAGIGCVTLAVGGWDTHLNNFTELRNHLLPLVDRGVSNLVQDLYDRGMENDVVTVMWGDFGRTPRINNNPNTGAGGGRDHWPAAMSALVAGGGLKMGQAIGATNARGEYPTDRRYSVPQLLSTLYRTIGIDPAQTFRNHAGRPVHILDDREPVAELV